MAIEIEYNLVTEGFYKTLFSYLEEIERTGYYLPFTMVVNTHAGRASMVKSSFLQVGPGQPHIQGEEFNEAIENIKAASLSALFYHSMLISANAVYTFVPVPFQSVKDVIPQEFRSKYKKDNVDMILFSSLVDLENYFHTVFIGVPYRTLFGTSIYLPMDVYSEIDPDKQSEILQILKTVKFCKQVKPFK